MTNSSWERRKHCAMETQVDVQLNTTSGPHYFLEADVAFDLADPDGFLRLDR